MLKLAPHDQLARRRFEMHRGQPSGLAEDQSGPALWRGLPFRDLVGWSYRPVQCETFQASRQAIDIPLEHCVREHPLSAIQLHQPSPSREMWLGTPVRDPSSRLVL